MRKVDFDEREKKAELLLFQRGEQGVFDDDARILGEVDHRHAVQVDDFYDVALENVISFFLKVNHFPPRIRSKERDSVGRGDDVPLQPFRVAGFPEFRGEEPVVGQFVLARIREVFAVRGKQPREVLVDFPNPVEAVEVENLDVVSLRIEDVLKIGEDGFHLRFGFLQRIPDDRRFGSVVEYPFALRFGEYEVPFLHGRQERVEHGAVQSGALGNFRRRRIRMGQEVEIRGRFPVRKAGNLEYFSVTEHKRMN